MTDGALTRASDLLREASSVLILSGAGISAESGVPTFRGDEGLWGDFRAEDLATPGAFARDPRLVWEWYGWRREQIGECRPNAAHVAIARWQAADDDVRIATQNVDGLHALAAIEAGVTEVARSTVELHGALFRSRCVDCGFATNERFSVDATSVDTLPRCESCRGLLRPDVVWFGEALDPAVIELAFEWASRADVCLVVGTSALVHPAASLPSVTLEHGGGVVEVNPEPTPLSHLAAVSLRATAGECVPRIVPGGRTD